MTRWIRVEDRAVDPAQTIAQFLKPEFYGVCSNTQQTMQCDDLLEQVDSWWLEFLQRLPWPADTWT